MRQSLYKEIMPFLKDILLIKISIINRYSNNHIIIQFIKIQQIFKNIFVIPKHHIGMDPAYLKLHTYAISV